MKKIILASKSPYRKQLLERLGVAFETMNSNYDESPLKSKISDPVELTKKLAYYKAKSVQDSLPTGDLSIIIGSDQVAHLAGEILGKTGSEQGSIKQLGKLQGKTHQLITSYVILQGDKLIEHTNITSLSMKDLGPQQINNYLRADKPFDCAGSYKLELKGISLFNKIETQDHTAIIGLPLISLSLDLEKFGIEIPTT